METTKSIITTIQQRYSCRNYDSSPIEEGLQRAVTDYIALLPPGPFHGSKGANGSNRFQLIAASEKDRGALRGLGTYGFIKNPPAFIVGAAQEGPFAMEDFGYRMEQIILFATTLGLGTCWLGGTFTRGTFADKIAARKNEILPAVISCGYPAPEDNPPDNLVRPVASTRGRLAWETLFFDEGFGHPLSPQISGDYATPLEMVRLAPSASNKQPWRILKQGERWHFYLQRTKGYREMALARFTGIADMQQVDMGIAMCHFDLAARENGLAGRWEIDEPDIEEPDTLTHYFISWIPDAK